MWIVGDQLLKVCSFLIGLFFLLVFEYGFIYQGAAQNAVQIAEIVHRKR